MLEEFLADIGLHNPGESLSLRDKLAEFDSWLRGQEVNDDDVAYLSARIAAYLCLYLVDSHGGEQVVVDGRLLVRVPVGWGVVREFDVYRLAYGAAQRKPCSISEIVQAMSP